MGEWNGAMWDSGGQVSGTRLDGTGRNVGDRYGQYQPGIVTLTHRVYSLILFTHTPYGCIPLGHIMPNL